MGQSAENSYVRELPSVPDVPALPKPFKLWKVDTKEKHSFYTLAETIEEAKIFLAQYETDEFPVKPVDHSVLVLPTDSMFLKPDEAEELLFAHREFGNTLDVALPMENELQQNHKEQILTSHTEQMKALKSIAKRSGEQGMQK